MPTSPALRTAYHNLFIGGGGGTAEDRRTLGDPGLLPRPWIPATCTDRALRAALWVWLDDVVTWLNHQCVWDPAAGMIPPCWPQHPHLVNEIAVLADQRRRAHLDTTSSSLEEWHRYCLPNFHSRLQARLRNGCDEKHTPWPAQPRHERHTRGHRARLDMFNADLATTTATQADPEPPPAAAASSTPPLRLASDHGETIDPITGENG